MAKQQRKVKLKVGDVVVCRWLDTVSYGRTSKPDAQLILAEFLTYGIVSDIDHVRIVVRTEEEVTPHPDSSEDGIEYRRVMEPVLIPIGCIADLAVMRSSASAVVTAGVRGTGEDAPVRRTSRKKPHTRRRKK